MVVVESVVAQWLAHLPLVLEVPGLILLVARKISESELGLTRLIEISVNQSIYKRKTIIDMKIQESVSFNGSSVKLFN